MFQPDEHDTFIMEAESVGPGKNWVKVGGDVQMFDFGPSYGTGYLRFEGNSDAGGDPGGINTYRVQVKQAGLYVLLLRHGGFGADATISDKNNDCYTRIEGAPGALGKWEKSYISGHRINWSWQLVREGGSSFDLAPGIYNLQIAGRSKRYFYDRVAFYRFTGTEPLKRILREALAETPHVCRDAPNASAFGGIP